MKSTIATRATLGALFLAALASQAGAEVHAFGAPAPVAGLVHTSFMPCTQHAYCTPASQWVPGHRETVQHEVWIPAKSIQVWVPPVFESRCDFFGVVYQVQIQAGYYQTQHQPAHKQLVTETVFVQGFWEATCKPLPQPVFGKPYFGPKVKVYPKHKGSSFGGYGKGGFGGKQKKHKGYGG